MEEKDGKVKKKKIASTVEVVKWANHYSSVQQILLVGEGDFSFSLSLANAFGSASNMVSTSLDCYDTLLIKYSKAKSNLESLKKLGAIVLHGVNAMEMRFHKDLETQKFDRIVFNFPHAGFKGREDDMRMIKQLVDGFFKNAIKMLLPYAEIHISHKMGGPFHKWNLQELASNNSLILMERASFRIEDYPGYNNKRGDGVRSDQPFPLGKCSTFKFKIRYPHKEKKTLEVNSGSVCGSTEIIRTNPNHLERYRTSSWVGTNFMINVEGNTYWKEPDVCSSNACDAYRSIVRVSQQEWQQNLVVRRRFGGESYRALPGRTVSRELRYFGEQNQSVCLRSLIPRHDIGAVSSQAYMNEVPGSAVPGEKQREKRKRSRWST